MRNLIICTISILTLGSCSLLVDFEPQKTSQERNCHDNLDNDDDGEIDCGDQDCFESPDCGTVNNVNNVVNPEDCMNAEDDDGDGLVDCEDEDCWSDPNCPGQNELCYNDFDDDHDGATDCDDSDCAMDPNCAPAELCRNGMDDDGDGTEDCDDSDCWGIDGCNYPGGETDCGNVGDDDGDGYVDCEDDDCTANVICAQDLQYCGAAYYYDLSGQSWYYFSNLIGEAASTACPANFHCTIKRDVTDTPYCYPRPAGTDLSQPYQACGNLLKCGPGMICAHSPTLSPLLGNQDVCLPLCAPGWQPACPGTGNLCMFNWLNVWFAPGSINVEVWLCDKPECDPMDTDLNGCALNRACYPDPSLMGPASCHAAGTIPVGAVCVDDLSCVPGAVCRYSENTGDNVCRDLCLESTTCANGSVCIKEDPRQNFGFCR